MARALTRNPERADDLVPDTLLRALPKSIASSPGTNIRAWLFTVIDNQNVNTARRSVREGVCIDVEQVSSPLIAATDLAAARQLFELGRAIGQRPSEQRQVRMRISLEGMSSTETAALRNIRVSTVRSRLSRGRATLRMRMGIGVTAHAARIDTTPAIALAA
jgi:RNA polymerase sigma-70 factor, ECF subfamily